MALDETDLKAIQALLIPIEDKIQILQDSIGDQIQAALIPVEGKIQILEVSIWDKIQTLEVSIWDKIRTLEVSIGDKIQTLEVSIGDKIQTYLIPVEDKILEVEGRMNERFNTIDLNFDTLFKRDESRQQEYLVITNQMSRIEDRVTTLEKKLS